MATRVRSSALAILAGLLLAASVPPFGWWPAAFIGVALWDQLLAGARPRARFLRSFLMAVAWFAPTMLWMVELTAIGYPVAVIVYAAMVGLAGAAVPGRAAPSWIRWIAMPAAFTLAEITRWTLPFGGVPLATTAMSQAAAPLGQIARVLCAIGVVFAVAVVGVALSAAWERRWVVACGALAFVVALWGFAMVAPRGREVRVIRAAVVQGGGPQGTHAATSDSLAVFRRHLDASADVHTPVDLVVWPENVVDVEGPIGANLQGAALSALAEQLDTTLVAGVTEGVDAHTFTNVAQVYLPDGSEGERYEKVRRVPFGEYVPLRSFIEWAAGSNSGLPARDARAGTGPAVLHTPAGSLAVAISWEIFFTNRGRDGVLHGGEILLNPTNGSSYWLTEVQSQQVASSRLRAIENDRWVLQAAPTGFSAIINPTGGLIERTGISERAVLEHEVGARSGDTIATRIGPNPMVGVSALLVALAWWLALGRPIPGRRRSSTSLSS
jgi:apolipoprotein N-acyltransferase